jgi:hypothetical protein
MRYLPKSNADREAMLKAKTRTVATTAPDG